MTTDTTTETTETTAPAVDLTPTEFMRTLTGFDHIAIAKAFKDTLKRLDGVMTAYALVFIARKREGDRDADAYLYALGLTMPEVRAYFVLDPETEAEAAAEDQEDEGLGEAARA